METTFREIYLAPEGSDEMNLSEGERNQGGGSAPSAHGLNKLNIALASLSEGLPSAIHVRGGATRRVFQGFVLIEVRSFNYRCHWCGSRIGNGCSGCHSHGQRGTTAFDTHVRIILL